MDDRRPLDPFADNLGRLLGLHALPAKEAAEMLNLSQSAFSKWAHGGRQPNLNTVLRFADFFGVSADRLARAPFEDILSNDLADPARFRAVEAEISKRRSILRELRNDPAYSRSSRLRAIEMEQRIRGTTRDGGSHARRGRGW
ncbi:MAG TPA: helix-turn-helix transcriptional regulator [Gaiellaceae bacterium]|jgi:transcriptional regulator with XRE-family HTH domain|nr:helix-turn-helix transcriptional regulator [Gaiellaceae bacterium]